MKKLSDLRKIFEQTNVEDSQQIMKTASTTRKTTPARKTTLKQEDKPHLQCGQEEMTKTTDIKFDFKFGRFDNVGRQQEIL